MRRLDPQHQSLETIVVAATEGSLPPQIGRTPCSDARFKRLASWVKAGKLLHGQRIKRSGELATDCPGRRLREKSWPVRWFLRKGRGVCWL